MNKITALALGLLLLVVPGAFAQYGGTGGTQTFTVPTLTINPGPLTVSGTFALSGDLSMGSGAQLLLDDGAVGAPGLAFASEVTTGIFREAAGEINFTSLGNEVIEIRGGTPNFYLLNFNNVAGASQGWSFQAGATTASINMSTPGETAPDYVVNCVDSTGCSIRLNGDEGYARMTLRDATAGNLAYRFGDATETNYIDLKPAAFTTQRTITVPDLTGTLLLGGATNTLGAVTTTINSGTAFNIHSDLAVTIDGDADNNNTGAITLTNDNDTQQVLLTTTGISYISDSSFAGQVDDGAGNVASASHTPTAVTLASVTDGTDTAEVQITSANSINLDADNDADGDGTILLIADNGQSGIQIDNTGIDAVSEGPFTVEIDDGATEIGWMSIDDAAIVLDADYDDGGGGTIDFVVDNSQTALRLATNTTTVSVSDGTDTADIRMGQTSVTIDADVDDDIDGVLTLQSNNELVKLELDAVGAGGLRGTTTGAGGQITMNSATTIYLAGDSDVDNSGDATLTGDYVYITGDQAGDGTGDVTISNGTGSVALVVSGGESITGLGRNAWTPQDFDVADSGDGNPGVGTLTPTRGTVICNCADANGCTVTMGETGAVNGQMVEIVTETATPNLCNFADTAGVSELAGAFAADQWDSLKLIYVVDRWVEVSRSDN